MQFEIKIDPSCEEPKVLIITDKMNDEVTSIVQYLSQETPQMLAGFQEDIVKVLEQSDIQRIYSTNGKVIASTTHGEYQLRLRLYELDERLDKKCFVRISHSEIINFKKVKGFDLSFTGTICVTLLDGSVTYVSRRYVTKIKQLLGI